MAEGTGGVCAGLRMATQSRAGGENGSRKGSGFGGGIGIAFFSYVVLVMGAVTMCGRGARADVYMVLMEGEPAVGYRGNIPGLAATDVYSRKTAASYSAEGLDARRSYSAHLLSKQDSLLDAALGAGSFKKLYGYHHLLNGFAVDVSPDQVAVLRRTPGVKHIEKSQRFTTFTTHTPSYLGLSNGGLWQSAGGPDSAGEDVIIAMVDTGITPLHPSFANPPEKPYGPLPRYLGTCEVADSFPAGSCNNKIIGAQHFAAAAKSDGAFNSTADFDSPLDGDGHGTHTSSIAAGNHDVTVMVSGAAYGNASGMAPRARVAVYKALYRMFGGMNADVVAAIDKAVQDGVDIINLSLGPNSPPADTTTTFLSVFDLACLSAIRAGIIVVQAVGNGGPYPQSTLSFSPWITSVAAGVDDRSYPNFIDLGNDLKIMGEGLSPATPGENMIKMVLASDAVVGPVNPVYDPSDCQDPTSLNEKMISGNILICTYSFNFIYGGSTMTNVEATTRNLSAAGFVMVVQSDTAGSKFDPSPISVPGIIIPSQNDSQTLLDYYNSTTLRDVKGQAETFGAEAKIGNGQTAVYSGSPPSVAMFSSRGPDIRDFSFNNADVLKPTILAPGSLIWASWTSLGTDLPNYFGMEFAMVSGTSMATPHISGIVALLKQKYPNWGPSILNSAISTTAIATNPDGTSLQAQQLAFPGAAGDTPGTPFDFGSGAVNATAAADPGLVFEADYDDYMKFICATPGIDYASVLNLTGNSCNSSSTYLPTDLNTPAITIAQLNGSRTVTRAAMSVSTAPETYTLSGTPPDGIFMSIEPQNFTVSNSQVQYITVTFTVNVSSQNFVFGEVFYKGNLGHSGHLPVSIIASEV